MGRCSFAAAGLLLRSSSSAITSDTSDYTSVTSDNSTSAINNTSDSVMIITIFSEKSRKIRAAINHGILEKQEDLAIP